ncbi:MAG: bifunctional DNA-formamidopyrimidine glycosylase/DNA-(apurinic or apyrimidinic site) lyase [Pelomonas sp.]|nr:bifunctional DNA-formamidopyrimidine glycosylase/DNA-(apurinic or apyrimidinic site) lyase [Roseateles sp.]
MPELPEVEVTRQSIADPLAGAQIRAVRVGKPLRWPLGVAPQSLAGLRIGDARRRGKYIWLPLQRAAHDAGGLLLHLGMSGSLGFHAAVAGDALAARPGPHDHFDLLCDRGLLRLTDPRRFGAVVWSEGLAQEPAASLLARLGVEPFDPRFDGAWLHQGFKGRSVAVKQALLAGDIVVGAGNIYACEALFLAGIDPRLPAGSVSRPRCERLAAAVRDVLGRAVQAGGTTLRDFRDGHGIAGSYQMQVMVYGREGEPCHRCGTGKIRRIVQGQRATYFCSHCQKR